MLPSARTSTAPGGGGTAGSFAGSGSPSTPIAVSPGLGAPSPAPPPRSPRSPSPMAHVAPWSPRAPSSPAGAGASATRIAALRRRRAARISMDRRRKARRRPSSTGEKTDHHALERRDEEGASPGAALPAPPSRSLPVSAWRLPPSALPLTAGAGEGHRPRSPCPRRPDRAPSDPPPLDADTDCPPPPPALRGRPQRRAKELDGFAATPREERRRPAPAAPLGHGTRRWAGDGGDGGAERARGGRDAPGRPSSFVIAAAGRAARLSGIKPFGDASSTLASGGTARRHGAGDGQMGARRGRGEGAARRAVRHHSSSPRRRGAPGMVDCRLPNAKISSCAYYFTN